jgi:hypothetical protein
MRCKPPIWRSRRGRSRQLQRSRQNVPHNETGPYWFDSIQNTSLTARAPNKPVIRTGRAGKRTGLLPTYPPVTRGLPSRPQALDSRHAPTHAHTRARKPLYALRAHTIGHENFRARVTSTGDLLLGLPPHLVAKRGAILSFFRTLLEGLPVLGEI